MTTTEPQVNFYVSLTEKGNRDYVQQNLEQRASDVTFKWDTAPHSIIGRGFMPKESYEKIFATKLTLVEETEQKEQDFFNVFSQKKVKYWKQTTPPIIPEDLAQHIKRVEFFIPIFTQNK